MLERAHARVPSVVTCLKPRPRMARAAAATTSAGTGRTRSASLGRPPEATAGGATRGASSASRVGKEWRRGIIAICRSSKISWPPAHQNHILMAMCCSPKISLLSAVYTKVRGRLLFGEGASLLSTCQWISRGQLLVKMDFMVSYFSILYRLSQM